MPHTHKEEATHSKPLLRIGRFLSAGNWLRKVWVAPWLPWFIIGLGILLRFRQYLFNRSMWFDESMVALDIIHTPFLGLFKPLGYNQAPPVGFALLEKLVVSRLGTSEFAFRLIPFLAGTASMIILYRVAKQIIAPRVVPIALGLFAVSWTLIYYSSETKQYSLDVLVALALYAIALPMVLLEWTSLRIFWLGAFGALAIWFSQPSLFILGGIGLTLAIECTSQKKWTHLRSLVFPGSLWAVSFGLCYWIVLRPEAADPSLLHYWRASFAPFPPLSMKDVDWYLNTLFSVFKFTAGIDATGLAVALFAMGCAWRFAQRRTSLLILVIPIALALMASAIHKYPFNGRLLLFLVPAMTLLVADGVDYVWIRSSSSFIAISVIAVLFLAPTAQAFRDFFKPNTVEEIRPVVNYIRAHDMSGDVLYLFEGSYVSYSYYTQRANMGSVTLVRGTVDSFEERRYAEDVSKLRGHARVWIVFSHIDPELGPNVEPVFLALMNHLGKRIDSFEAPGASTYLYDLQDPHASANKAQDNGRPLVEETDQ